MAKEEPSLEKNVSPPLLMNSCCSLASTAYSSWAGSLASALFGELCILKVSVCFLFVLGKLITAVDRAGKQAKHPQAETHTEEPPGKF